MRKLVMVGLTVCLVASGVAFLDMVYWLGTRGAMSFLAYSSLVLGLSYTELQLARRFKMPQQIIWCVVGLALFVGIVASVVLDFSFGLKMVSDFASSQRAVEAGAPSVIHPGWCEYWCNYELLLSYLGMLIKPHILTAQIFNAIFLSATIYPVFRLSCKSGGLTVAILVSTAMAVSPALAVYSAFTTGEFAGAVFMIWAYYMIDPIVCDLSFKWTALLRVAVCGVILGASQMFKPIVLLFFGAFFAMIVLNAMEVSGARGRRLVSGLLLLVVMFSCCRASLCGFRTFVRMMNTTGTIIEPISESPWKGMVVGLNVESDGAWERSVSDLAHRLSQDEARRFVLDRAGNEWKKYPILICKKFVRLYQSDNWVKAWCKESLHAKDENVMFDVIDGSFAMLHVFFLSGIVGMMLKLKAGDACYGGMFALMVIVGFTFVIMLVEMQARYRISIYPFFPLVMAFAGEACKALAIRMDSRCWRSVICCM